jgi:hypothetical protein
MKLALLLSLLSLAASVQAQISSEPAFVPLFDGKTLQGWHYAGSRRHGGYYATNGVLVCTRTGNYLVSDKEFSDFVLRLEYKLTRGGNSGIAIRTATGEGDLTLTGNEIQLLDDDAPQHAKLEPTQYNGSLYKVFPAKRGFAKPPGEWNSLEVVADKRRIKVVLNGSTIVDGDLDHIRRDKLRSHPSLQRPKGHIGFLGHRSHVEFRNVRIRELVSVSP